MTPQRKTLMAGAALTIIVALTALAPAPLFANPPGSTMSITLEDGSEVILQPDSTWNYAKPSTLSADDNDDVFITLKDNRILWLKPDYTWTFTKTQPKANKPKSYPSVEANATATMQSLDVATKTAVSQLYDKVAANLRKYVTSKDKKAPAYLLACIKDEVKENELDQAYNQTKAGWKADAKVSILGHRVKKIMECLELQLTPAEEPEKETGKK